MKRSLFIIGIAVLALFSIFIIYNKDFSTNRIISSLTNDQYQRQTQPDSVQANIITNTGLNIASFPKIFKATNLQSGTIGSMDGRSLDNPVDNEFHVLIDQNINTNQQAYLEYELYGVKDFTSVCKGINDDISTGAMFVKISNAWSTQSEKIPVSELITGDNIIRFSVPANCDFGYMVKNVHIRLEDNSNNDRKLVVNQPTQHYYYKKFGYISGFVSGKGSEKAKLYANGKPIRTYNSLFEGRIEKSQDTNESWQAEITAVFEDGQQISTNIEFDKPSFWDYTGEYSPEIPYGEKEISQTSAFNLSVSGFLLEGVQGSITKNEKLSVTGLRAEDMALMGSSMINVTGGSKGFRCLPHGTLFDKEVKIRIKYDTACIPKGYSPQDIRTYYYDETAHDWIQLNYDTVDIANREVISYTNHFTDFVDAILKTPEAPLTEAFTPTSMKDIKFADPMAGYNVMLPPTANSSGTVNMSLPIEIPSGRQGMQPQLSISYNSESGNGWLGVGWDVNLPAITVDTRWGVPHYFADKESESYLLNGEELLPMIQRSDFVARNTTGDKIFTARVEGAFEKIIRHGNTPATYWWEVIDKQGVKYIYGKYNNDSGRNVKCVLAAGSNNDGNIAYWALAEVRDLNDNFVKYKDTVITHNVAAGSPGYGGKQIYPLSIQYTGSGSTIGLYKVEFLLDDGSRTDFSVSARYGFEEVTDRLLDAIKVSYNNQFVRGYVIKYKTGAFDNNLICTVTDVTDEYLWDTRNDPGDDCEGVFFLTPDALRAKEHRFEYYDESTQSFANPVSLTTGADDGDLWILDGGLNISNSPSLSKSLTTGWSLGGSLNLGLGANCFSKSNSLGGSYTYNESKTKDYSMFMDVNADGLPDRIFKDGDNIYFRKLQFNNNQLEFSPSTQQIIDLPSLGKSNNYANTWGIEGQILVIAASVGWTKTHNYNSSYFADVNADGYPDFLDDGIVYYNATNNIASPSFIQESSATTQYLPGDTCNFIIRSGEVNDSVYTPFPGGEDLNYDYRRDAVRVWVAPYTGRIAINSSIRLIEDTSYSRLQSHLVDGIVYNIQKSGTVLKREKLNPSDYSVHNWSQSYISISRGEKVYFRLQSQKDRKWDDVFWNPTIYYQEINSAAIDTNVVDADGKKIALFQPSRDLLIYNKEIFQAPYSGKVRIKGGIVINKVSDTVRFSIKKGSTTIRQSNFAANSQVNYLVNDTMTVSVGESINIIAYTNTNIDWNKISNNFKIYYYYADSVNIDTTSQFNKIEVRPMVQYNIHQNTKQRSQSYTFNSGTYTATPIITALSSTNGSILLAAKANNLVLGKKVINIVNGVVVGSPSITFSLTRSSSVYFDYYCDSLSDKISSARVGVGLTIKNAGLHAFIADSMWKFGNLYRGWGQFSYDDNDTNTFHSIDESFLHLSALSQNTSLITFDTTGINSFNTASYHLSAGGQNDPLHEHFNMMFPDLDSMVYRDYARESYVGKNKVSNSPMRSSAASQDTVYDCPLISSSNPYVPVRSVRKASVEKNFAYSVSLNFGLSIGYSHNKTESASEMDYFDMNGDRYPDIIGIENIQYTTPQGGFFDNISEGVLSGSIDNSEYIGDGASYGVNLPIARASNVPSFNSSGSTSTDSYNTDAKKGSNLSIGGDTYDGESNSSFSLNDVNGDGLPDKIFNTGYVNLNLGYGFGGDEYWGLNAFNTAIGSSEGLALGGGGGFNTSQYSWSAGINLSWSKTLNEIVMVDMNNDGFADIVKADGANNTLSIYLNTGHGFPTSATNWSNADSALYGCSTLGSVYLAGSAGFTFCGIIKIVINLQVGLSGSVNHSKLMISDFNNDGYPDIVTINDDNNIIVRYSNLGKINILKQVSTPTKSSYSVDYTLSTCDQDMPQRHWQMTSLKVFDGFPGDGQDTTYMKFAYGDGYYDRYERTFYGFDSVISMQYNNFSGSGTCYRSTIEKYHNRDFLYKGLKYYEAVVSGTDIKYIETVYTYNKKEITTGTIVPDGQAECFGPYYPAISQEDKYFYNGLSTYQIHTKIKYSHGKYGNIVRYHNYGDVVDNDDDIIANISYSYDTTQNLLAMVDSISVKDTNNTLLRKRSGTYDTKGQITQLALNNGSANAITDITYDSYGNIHTIEFPENSSSQRMSYDYKYDTVVHSFPIKITDAYGYSSEAGYDFRLGLIDSTKDISGNKIRYSYYVDGKPKTITGPKEIASGAPYTIKFEYRDECYYNSSCNTIPYAKTIHYDPSNQGNKISTYSFTDGLGRPVQSVQKIVINGSDSLLASGKLVFDAYGRIITTSLSNSCGLDSLTCYYNYTPTHFDSTSYDVLDRPLIHIAFDQTQVQYQYGFDNDAFGVKRFKTIITDPNSNSATVYANPQGLKTSVTNPLSTVTKFVYDPLGELLESTDPESNVTTYTYDKLGRMTQRVHPDAGTTTYTFDAAGNLLTTQTANLAQSSEQINYEYDYNRLTHVAYPDNPENDVYYEYGDLNAGNQAGKISKMQDASGIQEFEYGNMGELVKNIHTFIVPDGEDYTFETDWEYDCWNRVKSITYPDGEIVEYLYNSGGQLEKMSGTKGVDLYYYIDSILYNMYGTRSTIMYGNGTRAQYIYDPQNQRLTDLLSYDANNDVMQNITYSYDDAGNITNITNYAGYVNDLGGEYSYNYDYDDLYRLVGADGSFESYADSTLPFNLEMTYSPSGNITNKTLSASTLIAGTIYGINYDNDYEYSGRPHTVTTVENSDYSWDLNGNMTRRFNHSDKYMRYLCWDEENRLTTIRNYGVNPASNLSSYIYNAGGERTWKLTGDVQTMLINGQTTVDMVNYNKTLYSSPYMVMTDKEYTKHYYIEGERVCSKIGSGFGLVENPSGNPVEAIDVSLEDIASGLWDMVKRGIECVYLDPDNVYMNHELRPAEVDSTSSANGIEPDQFFYHSDHLGSSSFITDANGNEVEHLQYLPFGETFVDQQNGYDARYKFSAKEKDDETEYSYFGARYYDSDLSNWLSVDALSDKYPSLSPYTYCTNSPIKLTDPDGKEPIKPYAGTIAGFITFFNNLSSGIGTSKGSNAHSAMLRMGAVSWSSSGPKPLNTGPFNTCHVGDDKSKGNRYIYTKKGGWIDMSHFMFYAGRAYENKQQKQIAQESIKKLGEDKEGVAWAIIGIATMDPVGEAVQEGYMQEYFDQFGPTYSAYSYEDLPSDKYGADFGANYFDPNSEQTFGEQLQNYFDNVLKATNPENAPNYKNLPSEYPEKGKLPSFQNHTTKPMFISE
jgi:RHS repeat-associated protein